MSTFATSEYTGLEIAIIGMAGRFPGAATIEQFWHNLEHGVESIAFFADQELEVVPPPLAPGATYVAARGLLDGSDSFDAAFFGYYPREAEIIDPQQRLFLECVWQALEDAGYNPETYDGLIGTFAGASANKYLLHLLANRAALAGVDDFQIKIANDLDLLVTRVAYKLNLRGPSLTVQTACSTSLVAVHLACRSLLSGECDIAIAGGVAVAVPARQGYVYQEGSIVSPDGHCRAFDAAAQGTVSGNGVAAIVLKPLTDALRDGDTIHAVIKGSAINNDGAFKVGFAAPSIDGQAAAIRAAQEMAEVPAESISYVEAHGTGTTLGDPIEVAALTQAFRHSTSRRAFCALGSVKTNIGHLDAAAGIAGLIKTVLALKHRVIPPSLNYTQPNPKIDFVASPFYVNDQRRDWPAGATPRRAGVSSFGLGGANAHVILEEAPTVPATAPGQPWQLLTLSARTSSALERQTERLRDFCERHPDVDLADVAYTLHVGRKSFSQRRIVVCQDTADAARALAAPDVRQVVSGAAAADPLVVFMFPGGDAQYPLMGHGLYQTEPIFRAAIDQCVRHLWPLLGFDLRDVLYPAAEYLTQMAQRIKQPSVALPALFATEYATAMLWQSWGVRPSALIGHSLGEYAAATLAGVLTLDDALALVALRGQLFEQLPPGAMLSVMGSEQQLKPLLGEVLSIAAVNGPSLCVVSGPVSAIDAFATLLANQQIEYRRLHITVAAHSELVMPILDEFARFVQQLRLQPPRIPWVSNLTGSWITTAEATDPMYWVAHLRETVRFDDGLRELLHDPDRVLLEVGPGHTLSTLARQHPQRPAAQTVLSSIRHPHDQQLDRSVILRTLGQLWVAGVSVDWSAYHSAAGHQRVSLPTYPFERQRYWVGAGEQSPLQAVHSGRRDSADEQIYQPHWQQAMPATLLMSRPPEQRWVALCEPHSLAAQIADRLEQTGQLVIRVMPDDRPETDASRAYLIRPEHAADYDALLDQLTAQDARPTIVIYGWGMRSPSLEQGPGQIDWSAARDGLMSLLHLAAAIQRHGCAETTQLVVLSDELHIISGTEAIDPGQAALLGLCAAITRDNPTLRCRTIDVVSADSARQERLVRQLIAECSLPAGPALTAYRLGGRWVQFFDAVGPLPAPAEGQPLRQHGTYVIAGRLSPVVVQLARYLTETVLARLVLLGPSDYDEADQVERRQLVQALTAGGADVLEIAVAFDDSQELCRAFEQARARYGSILGLIVMVAPPASADDELPSQLTHQLRMTHQWLARLAQAVAVDALDVCLIGSVRARIGTRQSLAAAMAALCGAFARQQRASGAPWISVQWDGWQISEVNRQAPPPGEDLERISQLLAHAESLAPEVVIARDDPAAWLAAPQLKTTLAETTAEERTLHERPASISSYVAPASQTEQTIAALWSELLGIQQIGAHDNFFELGGHSLLASQLIGLLRARFGVDIPLRILFDAPSVTELAQRIDGAASDASAAATATPVDLRAEAVLDNAISGYGHDLRQTSPHAIFMTGATGFLGAFLLSELLEQSQAEVYCLVRAATPAEGQQRILDLLKRYAIWNPDHSQRIQAVPGDLGQPLLGLEPSRFATLAATVDRIYHCGAWVNFTYPYDVLRPTNVLGTQEVLRLATHSGLIPVHYVSTIAVFSSGHYTGQEIIREDAALDAVQQMHTGYAESKWVAEQLVAIARSRNVPVTIYRPGVVAGHSQTGVCNTKDFIWSIVKGCAQLGSVPELDTTISVTPVDFVSRAIVHLSQQPAAQGQNFHLTHPQPMRWSDLFTWVGQFGYQLRHLPYSAWYADLERRGSALRENALYPFLSILADMHRRKPPHIDCTQTLSGLRDSTVQCPPIDDQLIATYLTYFVQSGFMEAPQLEEDVAR